MGGCWRAPPTALAGLIEVRGLGIRRMAYEPVAVVGARRRPRGRLTPSACPHPAAERRSSKACRCRGLRSQSNDDPRPAVLALLTTATADVTLP